MLSLETNDTLSLETTDKLKFHVSTSACGFLERAAADNSRRQYNFETVERAEVSKV
jgi:hypothetical protein